MASEETRGRHDANPQAPVRASSDTVTDFDPASVKKAVIEASHQGTHQEQTHHSTQTHLRNDMVIPSAQDDTPDARGTLIVPSESPQDNRGILNDGASATDAPVPLDDTKTVKPSSAEANAKTRSMVPKRLIMILLPMLLPGLVLLACVLMLLQSITSMHAGASSPSATNALSTATTATSTGTGVVTRRENNMTVPRVAIDGDFSFLSDKDGDGEADEEEGTPEYPTYVATFFTDDEDWTDTLYASDDCRTFREIGTAPNEARDPCIMFYNGRYWVITCLSDQDGYLWFMVSSSEDLKTWAGPSKTGPFTLDRLPNREFDGGKYDVVAPEWFHGPDNSVHVIVSCGWWGYTHGQNWDDHMESYILDIATLTMSGDDCTMKAAGPAKWMSVNADGADRIDGNIVYTNDKYYLTIKRNGLNMELWENSTLSASGWSIIHDRSLYGYEAPCVLQAEGTWHIFADGVPDIEEFGTCMWTSDSIDGEWSQQEVSFYRKDGSKVPSNFVRHGTVLPVEGSDQYKGFKTVQGSLPDRGGGSGQQDGSLNAKQQAIIKACNEVPASRKNRCAEWVGDVYERANIGVSFRGNACDWYNTCCKSGAPYHGGTIKKDPKYSTLKPGMVIAVPSSSSGGSDGRIYGHIGIYIGNGKVMHSIGSIATCSVQSWIDTYGQYADAGWGWPPGMQI